jgi:hypothetical protein
MHRLAGGESSKDLTGLRDLSGLSVVKKQFPNSCKDRTSRPVRPGRYPEYSSRDRLDDENADECRANTAEAKCEKLKKTGPKRDKSDAEDRQAEAQAAIKYYCPKK